MKTVYVRGQGSVRFYKKDFVGSGGQGSIYAKGDTAYKIYADTSKMIPEGKIRELSRITDPHVIKPEGVVTDKKGKLIGYTMRFLKNTHPLCRLFTLAFKRKAGLSQEKVLRLVRQMQESVGNVHRDGALIVDLNEMNFLVSQGLDEVYSIDVDSYQTRNFPATALMPSIRDWQTPLGQFTELSDWFSFAIVSFQMFIGIHPFKGKHPVKGFEARMKQGISVFRPDVKMPKICFPFDSIPQVYLSWYRALFEDGKRAKPPTDLTAAIIISPTVRIVASSTGALLIETEAIFAGDILGLVEHGNRTVVWTTKGTYVDQRRVAESISVAGVGFSPRMNQPILASVEGQQLVLRDLQSKFQPGEPKQPLPLQIRADQAMSYEGRIYVRSRDSILEVLLNDVGNSQVVASTRRVATVSPHAAQMFPGVVIQNLLGSTFINYFPRTGAGIQVRVSELDGYRIVDAKFDRQVLMVLGQRPTGEFDRLVMRFEDDAYDMRKVEDVTLTGINFVTLDTGVCVTMTEEETLELFSNRRGSTAVKIVRDDALGGDMQLFQQRGQLAFPQGNTLKSMRMK
jgi:serine/threonine protein kinase